MEKTKKKAKKKGVRYYDKKLWKQVENFPSYLVSRNGDIVSLFRGKIKIPTLNKARGYEYVCLYNRDYKKIKKNYAVHRLILETFNPNDNLTLQVNHIDGNRRNNKLDNLEWCTRSENQYHAYNVLERKRLKPACSKINMYIATVIRMMKKYTKLKNSEIGEKFNLKQPAVSLILNNKRWSTQQK